MHAKHVIAFATLSLFLITDARAQTPPPAPSVIVVETAERDVTPQFEYPGRAEAVKSVDIRARVEGFLESRDFREGADVAEGDILFRIERAPYEVIVDQRRAEVASAQAALKNAEADYKRKEALVKRNDVARAQLDESLAAMESARADVLRTQAALRAANLDLDYTTIQSPIAGRISRSRYSAGNLVSPSSEALATVTSYDPIYITIQVSEKQLINSRKRGIDLDNPPVAPTLKLSDGSSYPFGGTFNYLAPSVDRGTDTITARASFPNPDRVLLPGQFVSVIVRQKAEEKALAVPQIAVQQDSKGYFILVVGEGDIAEIRRIEVGRQIETDWIVTSGLAVGERVIVQGLQKTRPGAKVSPSVMKSSEQGS